MKPSPPTIGVVIVSYNTRDLLADCLQSLHASSLPLTTVVVDNASSDGSAALVEACFPEACLYALNHNAGFAAATNLGLRVLGFGTDATATNQQHPMPDFALLLNPDTVVRPGAIEHLVNFLRAHPRVGLVGPRLLNPDGSTQTAAFRFPTLSMSLLDVFPPGEAAPGRLYNSWWHGRYPQEQHESNAPFPIDHPLGACMLARQSTIEQVGLLDERYFIYSEEIEWCWRIQRAGWAIWQVPDARVTHIGGAATRQFRQRMFFQLHHSRMAFFQQHYSPAFASTHRAITRAGMLRATLQSWLDYTRHHIDQDELRARLWAYGNVFRL
jgi:hypothetical protein